MAFHSAGYPLELPDIDLAFLRSHLVIAPVIDYGSNRQHHSTGTGKVVLAAEVGALESVQHSGDCSARLFLVAVHKVIEGLVLGTGSDAPHAEVEAEAAVFLPGEFLGGAVYAGLVQGAQDFLASRGLHFVAQLGNFLFLDIQSGVHA